MDCLKRLARDLKNVDLPRDIDGALAKLQCDVIHGQRIYWYFKADLEYLREWEPDGSPRVDPPYSGLMVAFDGTELRGGTDSEIDIDRCVVIVDQYPTEKCYPDTSWIALGALLDMDDLVEVFAAATEGEGRKG